MRNSASRLSHASLMIFVAIVSIIASAIPTCSSLSALTTENAIVIGTKERYLWGQSNYIFLHDSSLVFEAPSMAGWTLDHIEVNFGCEVGGVTGSNVSNIFTIDNGYIQECKQG